MEDSPAILNMKQDRAEKANSGVDRKQIEGIRGDRRLNAKQIDSEWVGSRVSRGRSTTRRLRKSELEESASYRASVTDVPQSY